MDRLKSRVKLQKEPRLIVKSGTQTFYIEFEDGSGKRHRISTRTEDKQQAIKIFNTWLRDYKSGCYFEEDETQDFVTLEAFVVEYLTSITPPRVAESTYRLYEDALVRAIEIWGKDCDVKQITGRYLDQYIAYLSGRLSVPTVNKNFRHLKAAIRQGIKWQRIDPVSDWPKELREKKTARFLTKDQLQIFFNHIEGEWRDFCLLTCYTGLRSGELLRLTIYDVDNPEGFLRITPEQKNKEESRIPINKIAHGILQNRMKVGLKDGKIFKYKDLGWISRKFKKTLKSAGLPETFRFHDLRHTFASHLAMTGEDLLTIKELMRHKSIASTMIYAKLSPDHLKKASEKVDYGLNLDGE